MKKKWFAKCAAAFAAAVISITVLTSCTGGGKPVLIRIPEIGSPTLPEEKEINDSKGKKTESASKKESKEDSSESGAAASDENGLKKNIGIYVISYNSGDPELLLPLPEEGLHVTEMLSDGKSLYCFYSDGRSDGERRLVAYDLNDFNDAKVVFDVRR